MEPLSLEDLDEVDLLLTELKISQGNGNLILCTVASPAYRERIIEVIKARFPARILSVENGDSLISDLRSIKPKREEILIWILPETLSKDIIDALNNFRELFYDAGVTSLIFMTPSVLDDLIWKAPDFWRYRGGYHILKGEDHGHAYQAIEALSIPLGFSYQNKEELLRRKSIDEYLLEKINNKRDRANILLELGTIHFLLCEVRKSINCYEHALKICHEIGNLTGEGVSLGDLGNAYAALGDDKEAIQYYEHALVIAREIGDRQGEGMRLGNLGNAYKNLGETRKAIDYQEQALAIARERGDRRNEGINLGNLGTAYAALGETRKAIEYYEQALAIEREIGDKLGEGAELGSLGLAYFDLGNTRKAIDYYEMALEIACKIGDRRNEGIWLGNLSDAYAGLGEQSKAIEFLKSANEIFKQIESPYAEKARKKLAEWQGDNSQK